MALTNYITQTQRLLQNPVPTTPLVSTAVLTDYVNQARLQIAGESEGIRVMGTLSVTAASQVYDFSSINLGAAAGVAGVFAIKQCSVQLGSGAQYVRVRPFQWFNQYHLMDPVPIAGPPVVYAQYGQGETGSIYVNLLDQNYTLNLDCVCVPSVLATDADPEAIPYPWTDCVAFFAAFWAFLSVQRTKDADDMYQRYQQFAGRARRMSTPSVLPFAYPQNPDPTRANKLGVGKTAGGQG